MKAKKCLKAVLVVALAFLSASAAYAQKHTVSGYMTDSSSGESLIGAAVLDASSKHGTVTNNYGFYTLTLPEGKVALEYSYIGYEGVNINLDLRRDTVINIAFKPQNESLTGATVTASRSETGVRGTQMSAIEIPVNLIKNIPAIGGEVDILKAIQLLPGVQSGTEGSAGLYVRGGGPDENLLLLDGVPVYNVNHMLGFFSVFDADAIKNVTLYKGSFPARFGSRLSSVLDVRMKDGNDQEYHGSVSIGLLSAKFNAEGPIIKGKTSFCVSFRRTYYDILAAPIIAYIMKQESDEDDKMGATAGYYFYDFNAKVTHKFNNRDKLYLSYYMGDDDIYANIKEKYEYSGVHHFYDEISLNDEAVNSWTKGENKMSLGWKWGNIVTAARWNHVFSPKLFMNVTANYTQYRHGLDMTEYEREISKITGNDLLSGTSSDSTEVSMKYNSLINDISGGVDFEFTPSTSHDVKFGSTYTHHMFRPSISSIKMSEVYNEDGERDFYQMDTTFGDKNLLTDEFAVYGEDNWSVTDWFKLNAGLRYSLYGVSGKTYQSLEPRLSVRFLVNNDLSFKAAYSEMSQYVHMLSNSNISLPTDLWVPVTANIEPMRSRQVAAGAFYSWNTFDFSVEGYYKTMDNVLEYRDGASFLGSTTGWEKKVACGRGWSYGVELLAQRKVGKTTGWIGYTWSRTMRLFDRPGNIINFGEPFPAKYDRRHDLSVVVNHQFNDRIDLSGTFVLGSGTCGSLAMQQIMAPSYDELHPYDAYIHEVDYLESRNNYRMPMYNRMDIGVNFHKQKKHCERIFNISVYNAYNRQNPFIVYPDYKVESYVDEKGNFCSNSYPILTQLSIFPIMPSVSWTYKF
ncbi:MAG: TonB-dependent receptor [Bacteroidales bacterium]|nr:TonB-dependent receptor [Bacteroidales bacterium]